MKIYTKKGDQGKTYLYRGGATSKASRRITAIGEVDELNCHIGLIITIINDQQTTEFLRQVQNNLFNIGADLATVSQPEKAGSTPGSFKAGTESTLESQIDLMDAKLEPLTNFILPGGSAAAAAVHLARAVCRRAERAVVAVSEDNPLNPVVIIYLNRLSDYLFMLARYQNQADGTDEILWKSGPST